MMTNTDNALSQGFILKGDTTYFDFKKISSGGFGITYKVKGSFFHGRIPQTGTYAVKEYFPKDYACRNADGSVSAIAGKEKDFQDCFDEFRREGRMLHELSHPGIVPVNEIIESNGTIYYVMQYLGDMNLTRYVSEHGGRLAEGEARRVMSKLLDAVGYLHSQRLNHLDIKPDNVMMTDSEDGVKVPVLIDFGVSKHFHANGKQTSRLGGKGYSEGYSPMEQYVGITTFSPKADIYALGATFFYMLTGKAPLVPIDIDEEWIRDNLPQKISQEIADAICHAMTRDHQQRTAKVEEFYKQPEPQEDQGSTKKKEPERVGLLTEKIKKPDNHNEGINHPSKSFLAGINWRKSGWWGLACAAVIGLIVYFSNRPEEQPQEPDEVIDEQTSVESDYSTSDKPGLKSFVANGVSFNMVRVGGGKFKMGAMDGDSDASGWEKPAHDVTLGDYMIGETEVTQELWEAVMGENPSTYKGVKNPVEEVSWEDCKDFIAKLNMVTGQHFRFPTEAEWEYAARGGSKSGKTKYSGSETLDEVAWYADNSGSSTHPVKSKKANELGIYDMSGNVLEWCADWYGDYSSSAQDNPKGPDKGSDRVYRGGSWYDGARDCRVSGRGYDAPGNCFYYLGFRLAL